MDSHGSVDLDESPPDSSPIPSQPRSSRSLFFGAEEETPDLHLVETGEDAGDGSVSAPVSTSDGYADPSDGDQTTWTASSDGDPPALISQAAMRRTAREGVKTATGVAHTVAARTPEARQLGLYLADEDDQKSIGDPLADIAWRNRGKAGLAKLSPDTNDLLRSMMGVGNYFAKQFVLLGEVRRLQAGATSADVQQLPTEGAA